jgi:hypothetical protein
LDLRDLDFFRSQPVFDPKTHSSKLPVQSRRTVLDLFVLLDRHGVVALPTIALALFVVLAVMHWLASQGIFARFFRGLPPWAFCPCSARARRWRSLCADKVQPFIYFQF